MALWRRTLKLTDTTTDYITSETLLAGCPRPWKLTGKLRWPLAITPPAWIGKLPGQKPLCSQGDPYEGFRPAQKTCYTSHRKHIAGSTAKYVSVKVLPAFWWIRETEKLHIRDLVEAILLWNKWTAFVTAEPFVARRPVKRYQIYTYARRQVSYL